MSPDDFVALAGAQVLHITPQQNPPGIAADGLRSAAALAKASGMAPAAITLRDTRIVLEAGAGTALLNHQRPLLMGRGQTGHFLDGHSLQSWAAQLDQRVFCWPSNKGGAFARSLDHPTLILRLDARRFFTAFHDIMDLSPINSGNATRRPARRGNWLYVPAQASVGTFRNNRRARGLVRTPDKLTEISLRGPVPATALQELCV